MMIDPAAVPLLSQAIGFLFDESKEILKERRERRKAAAKETGADEDTDELAPSLSSTTLADSIHTKQEALTTYIEETRWLRAETEIRNLVELWEIQTKNYWLARDKKAKWGSLLPPIVMHDLEEAENGIAQTIKELQAALSKVYERKVVVDPSE